jgi:hypothetical protein
VGFEPTIPEFDLAETVHALDSATAVIGIIILTLLEPLILYIK